MAFYPGDTLIRSEILSHCHIPQGVGRRRSPGVIAKEKSGFGLCWRVLLGLIWFSRWLFSVVLFYRLLSFIHLVLNGLFIGLVLKMDELPN